MDFAYLRMDFDGFIYQLIEIILRMDFSYLRMDFDGFIYQLIEIHSMCNVLYFNDNSKMMVHVMYDICIEWII